MAWDIKRFVGRNFTYLHLDKAMPTAGRAKRGEKEDEERQDVNNNTV